MGLFTVKSTTCDCIGEWSTLEYNDKQIYIRPCKQHDLQVGNTIYYCFGELFSKILTKHTIDSIDDFTLTTEMNEGNVRITKTKEYLSRIKTKYPAKILDIVKINPSKHLIKAEIYHEGTIIETDFDKNKQMFFSDMNDEPMWKKIDDDRMQIIFLYNGRYHTIEKEWEPIDY